MSKGRFHNFPGKRLELYALAQQSLQRRWVFGVIARQHGGIGERSSGNHNGAIGFGQSFPTSFVDEDMGQRPGFPPAGVIIIFGDFIEQQFLVVIGADPFCRIQLAAFEGFKDIVTNHADRFKAKFFRYFAGKTANAHLLAPEFG